VISSINALLPPYHYYTLPLSMLSSLWQLCIIFKQFCLPHILWTTIIILAVLCCPLLLHTAAHCDNSVATTMHYWYYYYSILTCFFFSHDQSCYCTIICRLLSCSFCVHLVSVLAYIQQWWKGVLALVIIIYMFQSFYYNCSVLLLLLLLLWIKVGLLEKQISDNIILCLPKIPVSRFTTRLLVQDQ
jgi:hypothetical protein